jgi:hypothetical protein
VPATTVPINGVFLKDTVRSRNTTYTNIGFTYRFLAAKEWLGANESATPCGRLRHFAAHAIANSGTFARLSSSESIRGVL